MWLEDSSTKSHHNYTKKLWVNRVFFCKIYDNQTFVNIHLVNQFFIIWSIQYQINIVDLKKIFWHDLILKCWLFPQLTRNVQKYKGALHIFLAPILKSFSRVQRIILPNSVPLSKSAEYDPYEPTNSGKSRLAGLRKSQHIRHIRMKEQSERGKESFRISIGELLIADKKIWYNTKHQKHIFI